jgi:two-component sensor histidine kinase
MGNGGTNVAGGSAGSRVRGSAERARTLYFIASAVLAALVPLILFAGLWIRAVLNQNERDLQSYLLSRASNLSTQLDAEIQQQLSVLKAIASVQSLDRPDLAAFHLTASRMVSVIPQWVSISLIDPATGLTVLDTLRPLGSDTPASNRAEIVNSVAERRQPEIHTRYAGEPGTPDGSAVVLYVPVVRDGAVRYVLKTIVRGDIVQRLLPQASLADLLTIIVDDRGRILARSSDSHDFVGRDANEQLRAATVQRPSGLFVTDTVDEQPIFTGFQRSPLTGWLAAAATDRAQFDTLTERSNWTLVATGALSLTLAGVLAVFLFYNVVERRVSDERLAASRALGELDARLLATTQDALADQRKSASEREVLLREIYHRVKNNLQIIQSLLRLGSRDLSQEQREPFESAVRRIGAMARVHSLLYESPDLASIEFKDYLDDLVRETAEGFGADMRGIRTVVEAEPMRIPLDTAVPLAFITVEVLTNAFKHAFPKRTRGLVKVTARQEGDCGILTIEDDGIGYRDDKKSGRRLGLTLVKKLAEQVGGRFELPRAGEATYRLTFPLFPDQQASSLPQHPASDLHPHRS